MRCAARHVDPEMATISMLRVDGAALCASVLIIDAIALWCRRIDLVSRRSERARLTYVLPDWRKR